MKGKKLADGKPLGGAGRLTDDTIDSLQTYYGMGIRNNVQRCEEHGYCNLGESLQPCFFRREAAPHVLPSWCLILVWLAACSGWPAARICPPSCSTRCHCGGSQANLLWSDKSWAAESMSPWCDAEPKRVLERSHLVNLPQKQDFVAKQLWKYLHTLLLLKSTTVQWRWWLFFVTWDAKSVCSRSSRCASKMREEWRRLQRRWLSMRSEGGKSEGEEERAWRNNSWIWKVPHMQQASFRAH